MKPLVFFTFSVCILFSCQKEREQLIQVSAKNYLTQENYAGLTFSIVEEQLETDKAKKIVYSSILDANGEANFEFTMNKNSSYELVLDRPANICYDNYNSIQTNFSYTQKNYSFEFDFRPCAYLKRNLINTDCYNYHDELKLYINGPFGSQESHEWYDYNSGCNSYYASDYKAIPMGQYYYKWIVTRNNQKDTFHDSFYLQAGEHKTYSLNY